MQLVTIASAFAAAIATVSADGMVTTSQLMATCDFSQPYVKIVNRCNYDVYIWSVLKNQGCDDGNMISLKQGGTYNENLRDPENKIGVSIKISKMPQCKPNDITQFEYYMERNSSDGGKYNGNFLDVSYVDCPGGTCPSIQEGYYLAAGSQTGAFKASADNTVCPVLSCTDRASCSKISYVNPDDVQTRSCALSQNVVYYMCGGNPPSSDDDYTPSTSKKPEQKPSSAKPTSAKPVSSSAVYKVNAAAVTQAPEIKDTPKIKTAVNVVTVTKYEYVNAKRHAHGHANAHARRHQGFHA